MLGGIDINAAEDTEPKSQPFKLFSEGKSPEVAIALNLEAGRVRAIYYEYWEAVRQQL
jgi:hypothetical protein